MPKNSQKSCKVLSHKNQQSMIKYIYIYIYISKKKT